MTKICGAGAIGSTLRGRPGWEVARFMVAMRTSRAGIAMIIRDAAGNALGWDVLYGPPNNRYVNPETLGGLQESYDHNIVRGMVAIAIRTTRPTLLRIITPLDFLPHYTKKVLGQVSEDTMGALLRDHPAPWTIERYWVLYESPNCLVTAAPPEPLTTPSLLSLAKEVEGM